MNSKLKRYATEQLASTGFVLLHYQTAFKLRPDIWATPTNCMCDLNIGKEDELALHRLGAVLFKASSSGQNATMCGATRSMIDLEKRIELIAGVTLANVVSVDTFQIVAPKAMAPVKPDDTTELQAIAEMELPVHDCAQRKRILRARQTLAERGLIN
ncbi:MAG: hypothetical protein PHH36_10090 [Sideroxydans sp.]|nr:hypothetical protein [Sideroxydans sp.]